MNNIMDDTMDDNFDEQNYVEIPGGKQIHATQETNEEWKKDTYLYQDENVFYFEQYHGGGGHQMMSVTESEMKEYVTKLLPILFTPEELKKLVEGSAVVLRVILK